MLLKIKKIPKFYRYLILSLIVTFFFSAVFICVIYFYPIKSITSNLNVAIYSRFFSPWPASALDQEMQERKRLKRYAKSEQKRRLEKQLLRMNVLSVPIYDLSLDDEAEVISSDSKYSPDKTDFLWPILPVNKSFINPTNPSLTRRATNLILPNQNWTSLYEGVYLAGGDEIKTNIPIIKDRRYLNFLVFPLTPGNIRVILGQYVWAKTFGEEEVQKIQKVNIPINDPTATNIRVLSISCSCYILDMSINQVLRNAREPIKVAIDSLLWLPNKKLIINRFQENDIPYEDDNGESAQDNNDENNKIVENNADSKQEELKPVTSVEAPSIKSIIDEKDPLLQVSNNQILVNNDYSTAFGYNVVFVQTPPINTDLLKNRKLLKNVAPNISNLLENAVFFDANISTFKESKNLFRQTIFQNYKNLYDNNSAVFQYAIDHNEIENTYQKFRRYGYKVVSITPPEALFFTENLSTNNIFSKFYNRWLNAKDWQFQNRNMRIDEKLGSSSGLDAIFNLDNSKKIQSPLITKDYTSISHYLTAVSQNLDKSPNWHPNQYILISDKGYYTAKVLNAFQNWTSENMQSRFFAHILLENDKIKDRPTLVNLKKSILSSGLLSLTNPQYLKNITEISYLDMGLGEIINTIKARRIENRTIIFLIIPSVKDNKPASAIYEIPGLIPKKIMSNNTFILKDILSTIFSNVGIPSGNNIKNSHSNSDGNMLEIRDYVPENKDQLEKNNFLKFTLLLKPNSELCNPIIWKSAHSKLFGIEANYPIFQIIDSNTLEIFPCSIPNKFINLTWYQNNNIEKSSLSNSSEETFEEIGGHFFYFKNKKKFPEVYFGKDLTSYENIIFMFKSLSRSNIENIFYVNEGDLQKTIIKAQQSFLGFDDISGVKNSKLALFVTPL